MSGSKSTIVSKVDRLDALEIQSSAYGIALPVVYGKTKIAGNLLWFGNFRSHEHRETQSSGGKGGGSGTKSVTIWYTYTVSAMLALCEGIVSSVGKVWKGDSVINSLADIGLSLASGEIGQPIWSTVQSVKPGEAVPYSGIAYIRGTDYDLGENAQMQNHQFEITARLAYSQSASTPDVNPADILQDLLTATRYGASFSSSRLDFTAWKSFCAASGILMSPSFSEQQSAADIISRFSELTDSEPVFIDGKLKMIPRCEESISGTYGTYTPDATPVYDLTDDDFVYNEDGAIKVEIKPQADAKNSVSIEYTNRANSYVTEVADAKDQADIDTSSERSADSVQASWICDTSVARKVAQTLLQRSLYIRKRYTFSLPWTFALLSPMDIVTISDATLGLDREPVRITSITEGDDNCIEIEAEELLYGVSNPATYSQQSGSGFVHDFSADPGNISTPSFCESPVTWTDTGLSICVAARGTNTNWGGCDVHYSVDGGSSYKQLGTIKFGSIYGRITSMSDNSAGVQIVAGDMPSASIQNAQALDLVAFFGGEHPEFAGIGGIVPSNEQNHYLLTNLNRGVWGTKSATHSVNDPFILMDAQVLRTGALTRDLVNSVVYFKFCSFNVYGSSLQSIETAPVYTYQITGNVLSLPPAALITGLTASVENKGVLLSWNTYSEPDVRRFRVKWGDLSATWQTATDVGLVDATYTRIEVNAGQLKFFVAPVDDYDNEGTPVSTTLTVLSPSQCPDVTTEVVDNNVMLYWSEPLTHSFPIREYVVREGDSWSTGVDIGTNGNSTFTAIFERTGGTKTYWLRAVDNCGNLGELVSISANVTAPSNYEIYDDQDLVMSQSAGTFNNVLFESSTALCPVNLTETYAEHFSTRQWDTVQDQIDAGYEIYAQPGASSGSMTWEIDYGATLPLTSITCSIKKETIDIDSELTLQLYTKVSESDPWTPMSGSVIFVNGIRYLKVSISVTGGMTLIKRVNVRVDTQQTSETGSGTSLAADAQGTFIPFAVEFLDVKNIQLQAKGTGSAILVLNFNDVPNPTGFRVLAFDTSGTRINCDFDWVARGIK